MASERSLQEHLQVAQSVHPDGKMCRSIAECGILLPYRPSQRTCLAYDLLLEESSQDVEP
jgi:hypothetical protein